MFSGLLGKLAVTIIVIVALWKGMQLLKQVQRRLAQAEAERERRGREPKPLDLAPCPLCGTYVPGGNAGCASRGACRYQRA